MRKFNLLIVSLSLALLMVHPGCTNHNQNNMKTTTNNDHVDPDQSEASDTTKISYLALGDSYTIGESVPQQERWPVQLASRLSVDSLLVEPVRIIARTGWTTGQLLEGIGRERIEGPYDVVSLLIGVNNQYQGLDFGIYRKQFKDLLRIAMDQARGREDKVFVLSIPNYGVTPFASSRDTAKIRREIDHYNEVADSICQAYGVAFFNITPISQRAGNEPSLVASDGLHPSGKQYRLWVDHIEDSVQTIFSE